MTVSFCTIDADSPEQACERGAQELGVPVTDVAAEAIETDRYRVSLLRAPSTIAVDVTFDQHEALVTFITPPIGDAPAPTREDVVAALAGISVTQGLLFDEIDALVADVATQGVERRNVTVARGQRAASPKEGTIVRHYHQPTEEEPDRHRLLVRDGDLLIEHLPGTPGAPGFTVTGETLPAPVSAAQPVAVGAGIDGNESTGRWVAAVPGFGYLEEDDAGLPQVVPAVTVSDDRMHGFIDLRAPGADEAPLTRAEMDAALCAAGVVHGLLPKRLDAAWAAYQELGTLPRPIRIADGTPPQPGRDAGIEYAIEITQVVGDIANSGGRIDYHERHTVRNVEAGCVLGTWYPAGAGEAGRGVDGTEVAAAAGAECALVVEDNIETAPQEDGSVVLTATIDGMVVVKPNGAVSVVDLLTIPGDVDFHVGNIDANGSVLIKGTIRAGFSVKAKHDITVQECIEEAIVEAGDALLVKQGIIGDDGVWVHAGAEVAANYTQHAHITCGGDVIIRDSDSNSVIECAGRLVACDGHGRLMGGRYTAAQGVVARVIGSDFGAPTVVSVGDNPLVARALRDVAQRLSDVHGQMEKIRRVLNADTLTHLEAHITSAQSDAMRQLLQRRRDLDAVEAELTAEREALETQVQAGAAPAVEVQETVYYGVDIYVRGHRYHTDEIGPPTRFQLDPTTHEVRADPL